MPKDNQTDRRILFEMTGRRLESSDFPPEDETDEEEDCEVLLDDMLGYQRSTMMTGYDEEGTRRNNAV